MMAVEFKLAITAGALVVLLIIAWVATAGGKPVAQWTPDDRRLNSRIGLLMALAILAVVGSLLTALWRLA